MSKNKSGAHSKRQRTPTEAAAQKSRTERNKARRKARAERIKATAQINREYELNNGVLRRMRFLVGRGARRLATNDSQQNTQTS